MFRPPIVALPRANVSGSPLQPKKPMLERQYGQPMVRMAFTCHFMPQPNPLKTKNIQKYPKMIRIYSRICCCPIPSNTFLVPKVHTIEEVGRTNLVGIVPHPSPSPVAVPSVHLLDDFPIKKKQPLWLKQCHKRTIPKSSPWNYGCYSNHQKSKSSPWNYGCYEKTIKHDKPSPFW